MTDTTRPSGGSSSELRRTIWSWSTEIPLLSADPFNLDARIVIDNEEYVRCTGRDGYTLTGCERGISPEDGGSEAKTWRGGTPVDQIAWSTTEVVTEYPTTPTLAMVGRDFAWDAQNGNIYRYHVVLIEGDPVVVWDDEPPTDAGDIDFLWASAVVGLTGITGVAVDEVGNLYVQYNTTATAVEIRSYDSTFVQRWTRTFLLNQNGQVTAQSTFVFTTNPTTYSNHRYLTADGTGTTSWGAQGTGNNEYGTTATRGTAYDGTNVWTTDPGNNRVMKHTNTGGFVSQITGLTAPTSIAIGPTSTHLYILMPTIGVVEKRLKSTHALVSTFTFGNGTADGQISTTAEGIAVDGTGRIWIADTGNHRIQVFDSAGVFLGRVGSFGSGDSQFKSPKQLAVSSANIIYVADSGNNRLATVQENPGGITPIITERAGASTTIANTANAAATATCNAGEVSIGGGMTAVDNRIFIHESRRSGTTGWTINARNEAGSGSSTFTPYVICLQVPIV